MTLDRNLLALTSARNIGALATIKIDGRPGSRGSNFTLDPGHNDRPDLRD